ncbi:MAG: hypothetical protein AAF563_01365 [Pseudomonadota bacterium]
MPTEKTTPDRQKPEPGRPVSGTFFLAFVLAIFGVFIILSVVFATLQKPNGLFAFLFLMAAMTVAFVGILGGTGKIEWKWITLGGAPAVYMGLIWLLLRPDGGLFTMDDLNEMVNFNAKVDAEVARVMEEQNNAYDDRMAALEAEYQARELAMAEARDSRVLFIRFRCREESIFLSQIRAQLRYNDSNFDQEPTFETFTDNHGDAFDPANGLIKPFNVAGTYILPVPILSNGSEAVIYHESQAPGIDPSLMVLSYDDDHPDLTIMVSDRQRMEWGCTRQISPQESSEPMN